MLRTALHGPAVRSSAASDLSWRVIGLLNIFRLLVPMVLLLVFFFDAPTRSVGSHRPGLFIGICVAYFALGLVCISMIQHRWPPVLWQALTQLAGDTFAIMLLLQSSGGVSSGLATLLILPAGATALIVPPRIGLLATSLIAIALLIQTSLGVLAGTNAGNDLLVAGLIGASLFAITLLATPLADRLRESEALVQQKEIDLANLNELNEFIVQHLRESIVVIDAADRIRLINETASRLLNGGDVENGARLQDISPRLLYLLEAWRQQKSGQRESVGEVVSADGGTIIRPHFVSLAEGGPAPVLVFLEDTSVVAYRVQQSKLASLGRLSASIAHEIRNPVGAMSHASQLLRESPALAADDRHLADIIEKNAIRVSQIIENILQLSRRETTRQERVDLNDWLAGFVGEFCETMQLRPEAFGTSADAGAVEVHFDPSHLHQVLWNLCDNAVKHGAAGVSGKIEFRLGRIASTGRPFMEIADRGTGIDVANAERIFEPFFTDKAGGTGLGLFISRELCQTNGALLLYEARPGGGSAFRIIFADPQRWEL